MDRIVDLGGIPTEYIKENNLNYLLEDEYLTPEAIMVHQSEQVAFKLASGSIYKMYAECLSTLIDSNRLDTFDIPQEMIALIEYSWKHKHQHILGRFDFGGGVDDDSSPKLLEFNADTPTMVPESGQVQAEFKRYYSNELVPQFNFLEQNLVNAFDKLADVNSTSHHSMLFTTLGYEEDIANLQPIMTAAREAGFDVAYADLPDIEFDANEGVFLESEDGEFVQYDYLYKLVPWEFVCFEEPELLSILHDLVTSDKLYVINPAYTLLFQSKQFLEHLYDMFPESKYLLKTKSDKSFFTGHKYVEKVTFGRLGENIKIYDEDDKVIEKTKGDFGHFAKVYQEYVDLYKDDDEDVYQASVFCVSGIPSCLSFRRGENLIIDDDAEFIPHFIL